MRAVQVPPRVAPRKRGGLRLIAAIRHGFVTLSSVPTQREAWRKLAAARAHAVAWSLISVVLLTLVICLVLLIPVLLLAPDEPFALVTAPEAVSPPATSVSTTAPSTGTTLRQDAPAADAASDAAPAMIGPASSASGAVPLQLSGRPRAPFRTVFDERFANNAQHWPDSPQSTAWFADGTYRLFARQPSQFVAIGAPIAQSLSDVVVTAAFRKVGGPPGGGYGLIVRDQGPGSRDGTNQTGRFYVLEAGDRGEVGMWRRDGDRWIELLPWTPSEAVRPGGAANELTVQAIGRRLTFLVNGKQVASQVDAVLADGAAGIFVGGDFNEVVLERFVVEVPN
jgi:hypothetical protein